MRVDVDVQVPGGAGAEVLQDAADGLRHVVGHQPGELEPAVDDHAALPEVQDLQVLEARQVGLQVRQQLHTAGGETLGEPRSSPEEPSPRPFRRSPGGKREALGGTVSTATSCTRAGEPIGCGRTSPGIPEREFGSRSAPFPSPIEGWMEG